MARLCDTLPTNTQWRYVCRRRVCEVGSVPVTGYAHRSVVTALHRRLSDCTQTDARCRPADLAPHPTHSSSARPTGSGRSVTPLVGRIAQLRELNALAAVNAGGGPTTAVVAGEPGIGKLRLITEVVRIIGWPCLQIQRYQNASGVALGAAAGLSR